MLYIRKGDESKKLNEASWSLVFAGMQQSYEANKLSHSWNLHLHFPYVQIGSHMDATRSNSSVSWIPACDACAL